MLRLYSKIFQKNYLKKSHLQCMKFSSADDSLDILADLEERLLQDKNTDVRSDPYVYKMKDSVVYIKNLQEHVKFHSILKIENSAALCIGIEKSVVTALVLNNVRTVKNNNSVELDVKGDIEIPLRNLGNVIDFTGTPIFEDYVESTEELESGWATENVNLISGLQKAPYRRRIVSQQLYTGHMRIDLNQPMVENNFILLKGPSKSGKNIVIKDLIKKFLSTDTEGNRRVIYITPSLKDGQNVHTNVLTESERQKCTVLSPKASMQNSAEIYLMPRAGLVLAQKLRENK
jgi:F0F1-type ATP synthase alpha subunit